MRRARCLWTRRTCELTYSGPPISPLQPQRACGSVGQALPPVNHVISVAGANAEPGRSRRRQSHCRARQPARIGPVEMAPALPWPTTGPSGDRRSRLLAERELAVINHHHCHRRDHNLPQSREPPASAPPERSSPGAGARNVLASQSPRISRLQCASVYPNLQCPRL